jgi:hypothetical protein
MKYRITLIIMPGDQLFQHHRNLFHLFFAKMVKTETDATCVPPV